MATYRSYKKYVTAESIVNQAVLPSALAPTTRKQYGVNWFFGAPIFCSTGCCCLWTVPAYVRKLFVEAWGAGGNGAGACSCNRCHHWKGAGGGYYNSTTIDTAPGCQYTICAGGVFPCLSQECTACQGCASYITGFNLSNFCAIGGTFACANTDWTTGCASAWSCCLAPVANGGSFGIGNHPGTFDTAYHGNLDGYGVPTVCHCRLKSTAPTSAPLIGTEVCQIIGYCWFRCGCWTVPYGHGGQSAMTTYCGACCGQGGTGGPGLVKITFF